MSTHHTNSREPPPYEPYDEASVTAGYAETGDDQPGPSSISPQSPHDVSVTPTKAGNSEQSPSLQSPRDSTIRGSGYVYYRVYAVDGVIPVQKKHSTPDPLIGRIKIASVPPPHTVASLKCVLVDAAGLADPTGELTELFETADARTAMAAGARVAILTGDLGATPQRAVALVCLTDEAKGGTAQVPSSDRIAAGHLSHYLYYRLYTRAGEQKSVRSFDSKQRALGRLERETIAPPRSALAVKRRIARVEGKLIYAFADLFTDLSADHAQPSDAFVESGTTEDDPIIIVQPERRAGLYNRPLLISSSPSDVGSNGRAERSKPGWLAASPGDILYTDGIILVEHYEKGWHRRAYMVVDASGKTGLTFADHSKLIDEEPSGSSRCSIQ
ncbi:hypothetical protein C8R44DRAFT_803658 [Mycena epipterygia]|nr:hypothetical protein C8R44DRAFT_803658 [Mycena epipterygia]